MLKQISLIFFILNFKPMLASAITTVYFFEHRNTDGSVDSFDKDGRFYHVALKYKNQILEAHPYYGVHLAKDINKVGQLAAVLISKTDIPDLDQKVQNQLGKKFNLYSPWGDKNTTQCSKLVGQIIGVSPVLFENGDRTLSPDRLYKQLVKMNFHDCQSCLLHP